MLVEAAEIKTRSSSASIETVLTEWLGSISGSVKPNTLLSYENAIRKHWIPQFGQVAISEISARQLEIYYAKLSATQSRSSIELMHAVLRKALADAIRWGILEKNPCVGARLPKSQKVEPVAPSQDQAIAIIAEARKANPQWGNLFALAALTGLRRGELLALRWTDVIDGEISVSKSKTQIPGEADFDGTTKSGKARKIKIDQTALIVLTEQAELLRDAAAVAKCEIAKEPHIFFGAPDGSSGLSPAAATAAMRKACDRLGLTEIHLHSMRHFSATQLIAAGVDIRTVANRLGHADASITLRVYSHLLEASDASAAKILGELLAPNKLENLS